MFMTPTEQIELIATLVDASDHAVIVLRPVVNGLCNDKMLVFRSLSTAGLNRILAQIEKMNSDPARSGAAPLMASVISEGLLVC